MCKKVFLTSFFCLLLISPNHSQVIHRGKAQLQSPQAKQVHNAYLDIPFNKIQMKHVHNSYQRTESLYDQATKYMVRSFELDLHNNKIGEARPNADWFVYHSSAQGTAADALSNYKFLSDAFVDLKKFDNYAPNHEVITIWIEMKDGFNPDEHQGPAELEKLIKDYFGPKLYAPKDFLARGNRTTLRETVRAYGWPTLWNLKGKYIFVILGNCGLYVDSYKLDTSLIFLQGQNDSLFLNKDLEYTQSDFDAGLVNRMTEADGGSSGAYGLGGEDNWTSAIDKKIQYLGTDKVNYVADSWATSNSVNGWPFRSYFQIVLK